MRNPYGIIAVNPARHLHVNYPMAMALIGWITSPRDRRSSEPFAPQESPCSTPCGALRMEFLKEGILEAPAPH